MKIYQRRKDVEPEPLAQEIEVVVRPEEVGRARHVLPGLEYALTIVVEEITKQGGAKMAPFSVSVAEEILHGELVRLIRLISGRDQ